MKMSSVFFGITLMLAPGAGFAADTAPASSLPNSDKIHELGVAGYALSATAAEALEAAVAGNPNDLDSRITLLYYYDRAMAANPALKPARRGHIFWIIKNTPELPIAGEPYCKIDPTIDGATAYADARALWLKVAGDPMASPETIGNAAESLVLYDESTGIALLHKAEALEPANPRWPEKVGFVYKLRALYARDTARGYTEASAALREYEKALKLSRMKDDQVRLYDDLAILYYLIGRDDKATKYADALLKEVPVGDRYYSNAVHYGRTILGLIAVKNGDIAKAKEHLNESADIKESAKSETFDPKMDLAKALLERGQKDAVLEYLELCGRLRDVDKTWLANRTEEVKKGTAQDFFGHLWINIQNPGK
jgi:tetratricopeptide (TPR) repeat protein